MTKSWFCNRRACMTAALLSASNSHVASPFSSRGVARVGSIKTSTSFLGVKKEPSKEYSLHTHPNDDDEEQQTSNTYFEEPLSAASFNMDLQNLASEDARWAQDALEVMEENYRAQQLKLNHGHPHQENMPNSSLRYIRPNVACYTTVIDGWLQSTDDNAAQNAESLLNRMERIYNETNDKSIRPNAVTYMLVCQAWADCRADSQTGTSAKRAEAILRRMKDRNIVPNGTVYTKVLNAWCRLSGKGRGVMRNVERLLTEMENANVTVIPEDQDSPSYRTHRDSIRPNIITYTSVINGYARCREPHSAANAEAVLERMKQNEVEPDMVTYTAIIHAWSKTENHDERIVAASRALSHLETMEKLYAIDQYHMKPSAITYSTCIYAIGNSLVPNAAELAEGVLRRMYDLHKAGSVAGIKPTTANFNALITAFARIKSKNGRRDAQKAESILVEMEQRAREGEVDVKPNVQSWTAVMMAWAESGIQDSAENAQRVLDNFEQLYEMGEIPIRPNVVSYTTVMRAWSYSRNRDSVDRVEEILKRLEQKFAETGDADLRPNAITYVTTINTFQRKLNDHFVAAQRAQETVDRMMRLHSDNSEFQRPSRIVFNALINSWSRSDHREAALQAEKIVKWMEAEYRQGDVYVRPDHVTFCGVLNAWANQARNGGARRAQQLLDHLEAMSIEERGFHQSIVCYNIVIKAWGRSGEPDAIRRAEQILEKLEERRLIDPHGLRPDVTTYSSVINCAAYQGFGSPRKRRDAFAVAMRTFRKLRAIESPNHITYGTLFKAISNLAPEGKSRAELVTSAFNRCCDDGQVDGFVLTQVRNACSTRLYRKLLGLPKARKHGDDNISSILKMIPSDWKQNVAD